MGCDIHMYVEYKKEEKWIHGDYFKPNPYFNKNAPDPYEGEFERIEIYGGRNYILFSVLAGVRDYTNSRKPVAEPKGIPEDCSEYVLKDYRDWDCDGHTHSWLTLKELEEYQQQAPPMKFTGMLSPAQAKDLDEEGITPSSWCQWTNKEDYVRREWEEENTVLIPLIEKLETRAIELLKYGYGELNETNKENIRIVIWFDN